MLRVGLTGGLGSGKSTVAAMLHEHGAHILASDDIAKRLMMPSQGDVYNAIVARFGDAVLQPSGELDESALARLAFTSGRVEELNSIVHPAVIARQKELTDAIILRDPAAIVVLESALIFETRHGGPGGWRTRFDCIVLVTAPPDLRIERYANRMVHLTGMPSQRAQFVSEAQRRLMHQIPDDQKLGRSDFVIGNTGTLSELQTEVESLWAELVMRGRTPPPAQTSLK